MYRVINSFDNSIVATFDNRHAAEVYILEQVPLIGTRRIYRTWTEGKETFYDIGDIVYKLQSHQKKLLASAKYLWYDIYVR